MAILTPDDSWKHLRGSAELGDVRIHELQHNHAARALAIGENLTMIDRPLGHSKVGTTVRYAHLVKDAEKDAGARTGDSIGAHLVPEDAEAA